MRWWSGWTWAMLGALGALGAASAPWSLDPQRVALRLNASVPPPEGLRWQAPASATITFFPRPIVDIVDLRLRDAANADVFSAAAAAVALSPFALFSGDLRISEARLRNPQGTLDLDSVRERLAHYEPPLTKLIVKGGRAHIVSRRLGLDGELAPFSGTWSWTKSADAANLRLAGVWNGQAFRSEADITDVGVFVGGGAGRVDLAFTGPGASLKFKGRVDPAAKPEIVGDITLKAPSLAAVATALELPTPSASAPFPFELNGKLGADEDSLTFAEAALSFGGQRLDGSLGLSRAAGRWTASANLAAERLDLDALIGPPPIVVAPDGAWSASLPGLTLDPALDLDLRISTGRVHWGSMGVTDAAFDISRRRGDWTLRLLEGAVGRGAISGELAVNGCDLHYCREHVRAALTHADLSQTLKTFGVDKISGAGSFKLEATAAGDTPEAIVASASGTLDVAAENGAISGCSFEEAMRRAQKRRFDPARDFASGETPFAAAHLQLEFERGVARVVAAHLAGPGAIVDGSGAIDLPAMSWSVRFASQQADVKGAPSPDAARLTLELSGPWREPTVAISAPAP